MLEVEIDLIIYLGNIVEIINVKISLGADADFDGDLNMRISKNVGLEVYGTFYLIDERRDFGDFYQKEDLGDDIDFYTNKDAGIYGIQVLYLCEGELEDLGIGNDEDVSGENDEDFYVEDNIEDDVNGDTGIQDLQYKCR